VEEAKLAERKFNHKETEEGIRKKSYPAPKTFIELLKIYL